jgi:VCBS repeat-containing protein
VRTVDARAPARRRHRDRHHDGGPRQPGSSFTCRGTCTWTGAPEDATGFVAVPDASNAFVAWTGACDTLDPACSRLLSDGDATTATFAPHALRLRLTGDGEGEFRIQGPAVDLGCSEDCAVGVNLPISLAITYFAHGSSETVLENWGGACAGADRLDYCLAPVDGATEVSKTWRRPPVAVDDAFGTTRNARLTVGAAAGVLANDSDTPGDTLTAVLVTDAAHGALDLAADGGFDYTPDPGYAGGDAFVYRVRDAFGNLSGSATATITVTNRPPEAAANSYVTALNTPLDVPAPGVLANDVDPDGDALTIVEPTPVSEGTLELDPDGDPLTVTLGTDVANGVLDLQPDGSFTYTPDLDFFGNDTFTYTASDGELSSAPATVTITVTPVNDAPVAVDDAYATAFETELVVPAPGVLENDTDPDGDTLTVTLDTDVANGTLNLQPDGSFTYTPDAAFSGEDTFTYTASDGVLSSAPATVTITVAAEE